MIRCSTSESSLPGRSMFKSSCTRLSEVFTALRLSEVFTALRLSGRSPFSLRGALKIATFRVQGLFKKNSDPMARIICNGPYTPRGHLLGKVQSAKHGYAWPGNIRH